jgi:2-polyprenyl-3-methyl-5-hydroxy-6-metoxy-1,4-benzoquinol methylase
VLDIGCGSGLFLNLLSHQGRISYGVGFDASLKAIEIARDASSEIEPGPRSEFKHLSVETDWPEGLFDVVSMIDVLHHIDPKEQRNALERAVSKVAPGGIFLFKDIGIRPFWRAWANRLHDLVLARQWIHYVPSGEIIKWMKSTGLELKHSETINILWYGHELLLFRRPAQANDGANQ